MMLPAKQKCQQSVYQPLRFLNYLLIFLGIIISYTNEVGAQSIQMKGRITDDAATGGLKDGVAMVVRFSDSLMIKFTHADANGFFKLENLPVDTYQVIFSHPKFADKTFLILGNPNDSIIDFKNVALPLKSVQLNEVTVFGYASPVYFKGDTLVYTADSFKVKENAVVEDLLKKLPGIRVDKDGKIYSQGKAVDQVLVDGDEFFGSDPTVATKNLAAKSVESVQVYDKKNENSTENSDNETLKVLNLQLKEDAKKGYFGKVSGGTDFNKFYEGQLLMNKFKGKQKISVFGIGSNTPNSQIGWNDMWEYGLNNEMNYQTSDDGYSYYTNDGDNSSGLPKTYKTGIYYTDQIFKKTKLSLNYSFKSAAVETKTEEASQYFFTDTSYQTKTSSDERKRSESNAVNLGIEQKLDSFTVLEFKSQFRYTTGSRYFNEDTKFITSENSIQRQTVVENDNQFKKYDLINSIKLNRDFRKKFRNLTVYYNYTLGNSNSNGLLNSENTNYLSVDSAANVNQQKQSTTDNDIHTASITYTEPFTKKIKAEVAYDYTYSKGNQDKSAYNFNNGSYNELDSLLTNNFENTRVINRLGLKFIYELNKQTFTIGAKVRQVTSENFNIETQKTISQTINSVLPSASYFYKFSDNQRFNIRYSTTSRQPDLNQLQPVPDNSDPNFLYLGNPDLVPTYSHRININYNAFKPVSGKSMWTGLSFSATNNNISNSVYYDSIGRNITQPVNVDGNYDGYFYFNYNFPLFSKLLDLSPELNSSFSNYSNFVNGTKNNTKNTSISLRLDVTIDADPVTISFGGHYGYTLSKTTINSFNNQPYNDAGCSASISYELTKKLKISSDVDYTYKNERAQGYNLNYYIWNAAISQSFFKKDNLILSVEANDLLNQNINSDRQVQDNIITDSKSNVVGRYILFRVVYKFNSNKATGDEDSE